MNIKTSDMADQRSELIVVGEHTLAVREAGKPFAGVLATTDFLTRTGENIHLGIKSVRLASEADFDRFRVQFESFKNQPSLFKFTS